MIRKQIYIEERQETLLKRLSRTLGVSEAELIRRGIDQCAQAEVSRQRRQKAWEEIKAFIQDRAAKGTLPSVQRRWRREELYDERWDRRHAR